MVGVAGCLLAVNIVNVLTPRQAGLVMDSLAMTLSDPSTASTAWLDVLVLMALKFLVSEAGFPALRHFLWAPMEFYSAGTLSNGVYSRVMNLSSDFHDSKSTSEVTSAITAGLSVTKLLESVLFETMPMTLDLLAAFVYLSATFGPYEGLVTSATAVVFVYASAALMSEVRETRKREMYAWYGEQEVRASGLQGWRTASAFNMIPYELDRHNRAVIDRVDKGADAHATHLLTHATQCVILLLGLMAGALLAVHQVQTGRRTPGDFVMLLTYWAQLTAPLQYFAGLGRSVTREFINTERLLELIRMRPTVTNRDHAKPLELRGGAIEFRHVSFTYDGKKHVLKDVSFRAGPGATVAIVGQTGAGKSTMLKLLSRFYDVAAGSVFIDGQDVRDVEIGR